VDDLVRVRTAQGVATQVVKAWVEIDEFVSLSQQRYSSNGESIEGGGIISTKQKKKSDKRPCTRFSKMVSDSQDTRRKRVSSSGSSCPRLVSLPSGSKWSSELSFTYNRAAVRDSLSLMGLDQAGN
jgi:hypothetical protein